MRFPKAVISMVPVLLLAVTGQAQTTNILDWQFETGLNPTAPTEGTTINPDGGAPLATITGNNRSYYYGTIDADLFGAPTGLWSIHSGQLELTMDRSAVGPVSYTLNIFQFIDTSRSFYPGILTLSPTTPTAQFVRESVYVPQTGIMTGAWYEDTYSWTGVNLNPSIVLDINGGSNSGLLLDEVKLTIVGNLTLVPEPSSGVIIVAGFLAFGLRSWFRRKA